MRPRFRILAAACAVLEEIQRAGANGGACHAQMYTMGTLLRHGSDGQQAGDQCQREGPHSVLPCIRGRVGPHGPPARRTRPLHSSFDLDVSEMECRACRCLRPHSESRT